MKIMTWNLKFFPVLGGASVNEEDAEYISSTALFQDMNRLASDPIGDRLSMAKNKKVDSDRLYKVRDILLSKFGTDEKDYPDVMCFQEIISVQHLSWIIANINTSFYKEEDIAHVPLYRFIVSNINDEADNNFPQKTCIVSKWPITEAERINIYDYFSSHRRKDTRIPENDPKNERVHLETILNPPPRSDLNLSVSGDPAWAKILLYFESNKSIRPIIATKVLYKNKPVWVLNVHMKSNVPSPKTLGITSRSQDTFKILRAWQKTVREIVASALLSFIDVKKKEFDENGISDYGFVIAGDFNTVSEKNISLPEFEGENTINLLKAVLSKVSIGDNYTFPDISNPQKGLDIDHIFWYGISAGNTANSVDFIKIADGSNYIPVEEYRTDIPVDYKTGKFYKIPGEISENKLDGSALFLCLKDSSSKGSKRGIIEPGTIIKSGANDVFRISSEQNDAKTREVSVLRERKDGAKVAFELFVSSGLYVDKLNARTNNWETRKLIEYLPSGTSSVWLVDEPSAVKNLVALPKAKFVKSDWEQVYKFWQPTVSSGQYYDGVRVVYKGDLYECIEVHDPAGYNISDSAYRDRFWKKIEGGLDKIYVSDHNALIADIPVLAGE